MVDVKLEEQAQKDTLKEKKKEEESSKYKKEQ